MTTDYIEGHYDEIIRHESDIESRLVEADFTIDGLKQCNGWFIKSFSDAGESIFLIQDDYEKTMKEVENGRKA